MSTVDAITTDTLREVWPMLSLEEQLEAFSLLPRDMADDFFLELTSASQANILENVRPNERRIWMRLLAPDDAADVLQAVEDHSLRQELLSVLDPTTRAEVSALLAYAEDDAGGLMNPRFARLRPDMTVDEAILYLRRQAKQRVETIYYAYVLDERQRLLGVTTFRTLFGSAGDVRVSDIMETDVVSVPEDMDQESVARLVSQHDLLAVPVVDADRRVVGIVTVDDIVDVVQAEATEDIQKFGGVEVLGGPYLQVGYLELIRKRAGWLAMLFVGEMLTTSAMTHYQQEVLNAVVLALFIPLIISGGGNSGSQASTLLVRAMALGNVRPRDWWRVARREIIIGLSLGCVLGLIALARIMLWEYLFASYGEHYVLVASAVTLSVIGVVTWGTICGAMLPIILQTFRLDPASASAPLVATLVDVFGVVIYFQVARIILGA
jgi:magnesium transporter